MSEAVEPPPPSSRRQAILIGCGIALLATLTLFGCASVSVVFGLVQLGNSLDTLFQDISNEVENGE